MTHRGFYDHQFTNVPVKEANNRIRPFPLETLPEMLRKTIANVHHLTQIPVELIFNVMLTTLSLVCQTIQAVRMPHSNAEKPVSLYLLTIAESGEGKTFIFNLFMQSVNEYLAGMNESYRKQLEEYKQQYTVWKTGRQAREAALKQAIKKGFDGEAEARNLEKHNRNEPRKPVKPKFIFEDVSPKALIQGLSFHPEAAIITDEAVTLLNGMFRYHLGLLNKGWDGGTFDFQRADGESYEINICLMISLMVQPGVFLDYLKKHGELARTSGLLSRFMIAQVQSNIGYRNRHADKKRLDNALKPFNEIILKLLTEKKERLIGGDIPRKVMSLSNESIKLLQDRREVMEKKIKPGEELAHISDFVSKLPENAIRLAAIFQRISNMTSRLDLNVLWGDNLVIYSSMTSSLAVMEWYTTQASNLFYFDSEQYHFEEDVRELYSWLSNMMFKKIDDMTGPVSVSDIMQRGPNRMRRREVFKPLLIQMMRQRVIFLAKNLRTGPVYIFPAHELMMAVPQYFKDFFPDGVVYLDDGMEFPYRPNVSLPNTMPHY